MRYALFIFVGLLFIVPSANADTGRFIDLQVVVYDDRFYSFNDRDSQVEILADEL